VSEAAYPARVYAFITRKLPIENDPCGCLGRCGIHVRNTPCREDVNVLRRNSDEGFPSIKYDCIRNRNRGRIDRFP
jgi:hypothetical protein